MQRDWQNIKEAVLTTGEEILGWRRIEKPRTTNEKKKKKKNIYS